MTAVEKLAGFGCRTTYADLPPEARAAVKAHVLDALGCAIGALDGGPIAAVRAQLDEFGGEARRYLNRLSDLLYVLARYMVADAEEPLSHT